MLICNAFAESAAVAGGKNMRDSQFCQRRGFCCHQNANMHRVITDAATFYNSSWLKFVACNFSDPLHYP